MLLSATTGNLPVVPSIAAIAIFLFLFSAIGGWRAVIYVTAAFSALLLVLMIFISGFSAAVFDQLAVLSRSGTTQPGGILTDAIPGVIQLVRGVGKETPQGGLWTTAAAASFAIAAIGSLSSPGFGFLGLTTRTRRGALQPGLDLGGTRRRHAAVPWSHHRCRDGCKRFFCAKPRPGTRPLAHSPGDWRVPMSWSPYVLSSC